MIVMLVICKVLAFGAFGGSKEKVDFSNEQLCFCYSDIREHNFVITEARQICVLDAFTFGSIVLRWVQAGMTGNSERTF
jgi:hypothetical protein